MRTIEKENGSVLYLNSGDWIENLTALEYDKGEWRIYSYEKEMSALLGQLQKEKKVVVSPSFIESETFVVLNTI